MRFFASSFGSVDVSRFDGKDKKLWPGWIFFHFCRCINLPVFCQCRIFVYSFVTGNGVGQETRWFGCKRRADRWSIELTTNRFVSFQFVTFLLICIEFELAFLFWSILFVMFFCDARWVCGLLKCAEHSMFLLLKHIVCNCWGNVFAVVNYETYHFINICFCKPSYYCFQSHN